MNWKNYFSRFFAFGILAIIVMTSTGCNLFLSDEEVISKMMTSMLAIDSYSTDMTISGEVSPNDENSFGALEGSFLVNVKGDAMMAKKEDGIYSSAPASYNIDATVTTQGTSLSFNADFKTIDNVIYLKVNKLPMIPMMDLSEYTNQWIKLDVNKILEEFASIKTGEEEDLDPRIKELADYIYEISQNSNVFIVKDNLGKDKVDGHKVHHLIVDIDKDVMVSLISSVMTKINDLSEEDMSVLDFEEFESEFTKALEDIDLNNIELFIDTNDFYLRRIIMPMEISPKTEELTINFNFDMKYDNFNEITVESFEEPEGAMDVMEMYSEKEADVKDSRRMSDMAATRTAMALSCSDGKTFVVPKAEYFFLNEMGSSDYMEFTYLNDPENSDKYCLVNGNEVCNYTIVNEEKKTEFDPCHYRINFYLENGEDSYVTENGIVTGEKSIEESMFDEDFMNDMTDEELELILQGLE